MKLSREYRSQLRPKMTRGYFCHISRGWLSISIFYAKGRTWRDAEKNLHAVDTLQRVAPFENYRKVIGSTLDVCSQAQTVLVELCVIDGRTLNYFQCNTRWHIRFLSHLFNSRPQISLRHSNFKRFKILSKQKFSFKLNGEIRSL